MTTKPPFPPFSVEKPIPVRWPAESLIQMQKSGNYIAEYKLDEERGFLCTGKRGDVVFYSHRGSEAKIRGQLYKYIQTLKLPPNSVFDGGHVFWKPLGEKSRVYIFDILMLNGKRLTLTHIERQKLLNKLLPGSDLIWRPTPIVDFVQEFDKLLFNKSTLLKRTALAYGVPLLKLQELVEGLVIKRIHSKLRYPANVSATPSSFKLRYGDILVGQKKWDYKSLL